LLRLACLAVLLLGCSSARASRPEELTPGLAMPMTLAEGHGDGALAEPVPSGMPAPAASAELASPARFTTDPPDPTPLRVAEQYEYTFHYENGKIQLTAVRPVRFATPVVTARRVGRYAVELWIGHELVDRVRFDFPLLAASEPTPEKRHKLYETPPLTGGPYDMTVLVPAAPRARSARFVDRATRRQAELTWPPAPAGLGDVTPMDPPASTAVASDGATPSGAPPNEMSAPPPTVPAASATAAPPPSAAWVPGEPPHRPKPPPTYELEKH